MNYVIICINVLCVHSVFGEGTNRSSCTGSSLLSLPPRKRKVKVSIPEDRTQTLLLMVTVQSLKLGEGVQEWGRGSITVASDWPTRTTVHRAQQSCVCTPGRETPQVLQDKDSPALYHPPTIPLVFKHLYNHTLYICPTHYVQLTSATSYLLTFT